MRGRKPRKPNNRKPVDHNGKPAQKEGAEFAPAKEWYTLAELVTEASCMSAADVLDRVEYGTIPTELCWNGRSERAHCALILMVHRDAIAKIHREAWEHARKAAEIEHLILVRLSDWPAKPATVAELVAMGQRSDYTDAEVKRAIRKLAREAPPPLITEVKRGLFELAPKSEWHAQARLPRD